MPVYPMTAFDWAVAITVLSVIGLVGLVALVGSLMPD